MKFIVKLLTNKLDQIKIGKGVSIKGITKPTWKDPKTNLYWSIWLFITSMTYFKTAFFIYTAKHQDKFWFKSSMWLISTLFLPFSYVMKVLRWIRLTRLVIMVLTLLTTLLYSPSEILLILYHFSNLAISNIDVLLSLFQNQTSKLATWLFNKLNDVKPSIDSFKDSKWLPDNKKPIKKVDSESPISLRKLYRREVEEPDTPFYKNPYFIAGITLASLIVIGGIYYFYVYKTGDGPTPPEAPTNTQQPTTSYAVYEKGKGKGKLIEQAVEQLEDTTKTDPLRKISESIASDEELTRRPFQETTRWSPELTGQAAEDRDHFFPRPENVASTSQNVASGSQNVASSSQNVASSSQNVADTTQNVADTTQNTGNVDTTIVENGSNPNGSGPSTNNPSTN